MTTGRINQVTAELRGAPARTGALRWRYCVLLDRCIRTSLWSRMRPRMGFALVRIPRHAGVRTRFSELGSHGVGSRRSYASLHRHNSLIWRSEPREPTPPDVRWWQTISGCHRCGRLSRLEGLDTIDPYDPDIRSIEVRSDFPRE